MATADPEREREDALAEAADAIRAQRESGEAVNLVSLSERFGIEVEDATRLMKAQLMLEVAMRETAPPDRSEAPAPDVPDDFEVLEEVGRGGMGVVYRARQRSLARTVALKIVRLAPPHDRVLLERFRREAKSLARLRHPHIVSIHGYGELEGNVWFSMDLIEGETLDELVAQGTVTPSRACRLLQQVAGAIAYSHSHGLVHRDLKPGNVLVDADDNAYVVDFGLAFELDADTGLTQTGQILGTPNYMAPEQARGGAKGVGEPTDVYALGALLYECLAGRPPFSGTSVLEVIQAVTSRDPEPPRRIRPEVPADLQAICLKAMEKEPAARYPTAGAFLDDLQRFEDGREIRARRSGLGTRLRKLIRRNRAAVTAGLVTAVLAVLALVVFVAPRLGESPQTLLAMASDFEAEGDIAAAEGVFARLVENEEWLTSTPTDEARIAHLGWLRTGQLRALARVKQGEPDAGLAASRAALARFQRGHGGSAPAADLARGLFRVIDAGAQGERAPSITGEVEKLESLLEANPIRASVRRQPAWHDRLRTVAFEATHPARHLARRLLGIPDLDGSSDSPRPAGDELTHQVRAVSFAFDPIKRETLLLWERVLPIALDGQATLSEYVQIPFPRTAPAMVKMNAPHLRVGGLGGVHDLWPPFFSDVQIDHGRGLDHVTVEFQRVFRLLDLSRFHYDGPLVLSRDRGAGAIHPTQHLPHPLAPTPLGHVDAELSVGQIDGMARVIVLHLYRLESIGTEADLTTLPAWHPLVEKMAGLPLYGRTTPRSARKETELGVTRLIRRRQAHALLAVFTITPAQEIGPQSQTWIDHATQSYSYGLAGALTGLGHRRHRGMRSIVVGNASYHLETFTQIHLLRSSTDPKMRSQAEAFLRISLDPDRLVRSPGYVRTQEDWIYLHALRDAYAQASDAPAWLRTAPTSHGLPVVLIIAFVLAGLTTVALLRLIWLRRTVDRIRWSALVLCLCIPLTALGAYAGGMWWPTEWLGLVGCVITTAILARAGYGNIRWLPFVGACMALLLPIVEVLMRRRGDEIDANVFRILAGALLIGGLPFLAIGLFSELRRLTRPSRTGRKRGEEAREAWKLQQRIETQNLLLSSGFLVYVVITYVLGVWVAIPKFMRTGRYWPRGELQSPAWWWVLVIGLIVSLLYVVYGAYRRTGYRLRGPTPTVT